MKVLVIDDDKFVTLSLKTILESDADIEVVAMGNNGLDAIRLYHEYHPDVLLMDIRMEEMNGLTQQKKSLKLIKMPVFYFLPPFLMMIILLRHSILVRRVILLNRTLNVLFLLSRQFTVVKVFLAEKLSPKFLTLCSRQKHLLPHRK